MNQELGNQWSLMTSFAVTNVLRHIAATEPIPLRHSQSRLIESRQFSRHQRHPRSLLRAAGRLPEAPAEIMADEIGVDAKELQSLSFFRRLDK